MRDIRRPYRNSKSSSRRESLERPQRSSRSTEEREEISRRRETLNKEELRGDIEYTREGRPIIKASSHFDLRPPERELRRRPDDFDVLKRSEFFNNTRKTDFEGEEIKEFKKKRKQRKKNRKIILYIFLILILLILASWTFLFDVAKVSVNPKYEDVQVSGSFLIFKEDVLFDYATSTLSRTVLKSEPKEVNRKAEGELTIYNNYSASSQVLIKNTRFQTEDGKIFRIGESVTVPGKVGDTPGSIKVKVSADTYGAEYNIGPSDFTIPGFKGTDRYLGFYAKSSDSMTGGISGIVQIVAENDIISARQSLQLSIGADLQEKAQNFKHEDYITLQNNPIITYTDNESELMITEGSSYELTGTASILSIKEGVLAKMIAVQSLGDIYNELENVRLDGEQGLVFELDESPDLDSNLLKVNVSGQVRIVWVYDVENIKKSLVGKKVSSLNDIMQNYKSSIVSTGLKLRPIWIRAFPTSIDRIKIIEEVK